MSVNKEKRIMKK